MNPAPPVIRKEGFAESDRIRREGDVAPVCRSTIKLLPALATRMASACRKRRSITAFPPHYVKKVCGVVRGGLPLPGKDWLALSKQGEPHQSRHVLERGQGWDIVLMLEGHTGNSKVFNKGIESNE